MRYRLVVPRSEHESARELSIEQTDFLIGRGADCDLRLSDSTMSRHHCILHTAGDELTVVDLGSSNGTYLNGQRVRSQAAVSDGAEIRVGNWQFVVRLGFPDSSPHDDPAAVTQRPRPSPLS
jgi:pSer/pThr/pTyr-binding forkhead associated (FHA) protein